MFKKFPLHEQLHYLNPPAVDFSLVTRHEAPRENLLQMTYIQTLHEL